MAILSLTMPARPAAAQGSAQRVTDARVASADSLIHLALDRARDGDTTLALKTLERATKVAPDYAPSFYQRGVLIARSTKLGLSDTWRRREAVKQIDHALDLDPNNPYYLLELGRIRLKTPLLRLDAERLFHRALDAAEARHEPRALADIHYELGQIYERRYLTVANRHLIPGVGVTFDPDVARVDFRYVRNFLETQTQPVPDAGEIDFRQAEDQYRAAIVADATNAGAVEGLLGLLIDTHRWEEMLHTIDDVRGAQPKSARMYLARGLALHRLDRDIEAEPAFDSALALLPEQTRRDMAGLATILRSEKATEYAALPADKRARLDSLYWETADPLALTPNNEARTEFLARVAYADLRFTSAEFDHKGWQTDRGQTYIRYGEPTRVVTFPGGLSGGSNAPEEIARITTVWWYAPTNMYFVFTGPPAMNTAWYAGDFRSYAEAARDKSPVRFDDVAARISLDSIPVQIARFRSDAPDSPTADVAIFADLPTSRMLRDVDVNQALFETGFFLRDDSRKRVAEARDSALVRAPRGQRAAGADEAGSVTSRTWRRSLSPGTYEYRVETVQPTSGHAARAQGQLDVGVFLPGQLSLSDVLVARHIAPRASAGGSPQSLRDYVVTPNASMRFARNDTLFVYWEEYGLARDSSGNGHARVELSLRLTEVDRGAPNVGVRILGGIADAVGLSAKGDERAGFRFDRVVPLTSADRVPNYLALDLGRAPYGRYDLELTVTDLISGKKVRRDRTITVPQPVEQQ